MQDLLRLAQQSGDVGRQIGARPDYPHANIVRPELGEIGIPPGRLRRMATEIVPDETVQEAQRAPPILGQRDQFSAKNEYMVTKEMFRSTAARRPAAVHDERDMARHHVQVEHDRPAVPKCHPPSSVGHNSENPIWLIS